jgi:hypothetical protein
MNRITRVKTLINSSTVGLALMVLAASPTLANTNNQILAPNQASSTSKEVQLSQQQSRQRTAPTNQTIQQTNQAGCTCCKSMMSNMPGMMERQNNMPGMMERHNNQSK